MSASAVGPVVDAPKEQVAEEVPAPRLTRDLLTVSMYLCIASWSWLLSALGPSLVLMRSELGVSRSVVALHGTAVAAGAVVAALVLVPLGRVTGRWVLLQVSSLLMVLGLGGMLLGSALPVTVTCALVLGVAGAMLVNIVVPVLSQHHHEVPSAAISEANAAASSIGLLAPLAVGLAVSLTWGWRPAIAVSAVILVVAAALTWPVRHHRSWRSQQGPRVQGARDPFPPAFWCVLVGIGAFIAIEFSLVNWSADLLASEQGMSPGSASAAVSAFVGGMAAGRWVVGTLALHVADARLLVVGLLATTAGWALLWTGASPTWAVVGLAVCGAGTGWLYPLGISLLLRRSDGRVDTAMALASFVAGLASGGGPFLLAFLADRVGTHTAFLAVPACTVAGLACVAGAVLLNRRRLRAPA